MKRLVIAAVLLYIVVFGVASAMRHYNFLTQAWDMGIFDQMFGNAAHGRAFGGTIEELPNHFGVHMSPWLYVLLPVYMLFPSPYTLLILQTLFLGLGAIPVYLLARRILNNKKIPALVAGAYLLYPALHWINLYDFHPIAFFIPLALAGFYFLECERWLLGVVFTLLAASTEEGAIIAIAAMGVYFVFRNLSGAGKKKAIAGGIIFLLAVLYLIISAKVIMPAFGGGIVRIDRYANLGATSDEIVKNIFLRPGLMLATIFTKQKLFYLFWISLPVAFLPLFAPRSWILFVPGILQNLLTNYTAQFSGRFQYDAILIPAVFVGVIYGFKACAGRFGKKERVLRWVFALAVCVGYLAGSPMSITSFPVDFFRTQQTTLSYESLINFVPQNASVAVPTSLVPHLAHREYIYTLGEEPSGVDIAIIDSADTFEFGNSGRLQAYIDSYMRSGGYKAIIFDKRYFLIYKSTIPIDSSRLPTG